MQVSYMIPIHPGNNTITHYSLLGGATIRMQSTDIKTTLQSTLTQKQELVRDYQSYAEQINNPEVSKMYRHFAEAEALHATQIREKLNQLQ